VNIFTQFASINVGRGCSFEGNTHEKEALPAFSYDNYPSGSDLENVSVTNVSVAQLKTVTINYLKQTQ
jgi:hypothetical protein